jgi:hypothetical protein
MLGLIAHFVTSTYALILCLHTTGAADEFVIGTLLAEAKGWSGDLPLQGVEIMEQEMCRDKSRQCPRCGGTDAGHAKAWNGSSVRGRKGIDQFCKAWACAKAEDCTLVFRKVSADFPDNLLV